MIEFTSELLGKAKNGDQAAITQLYEASYNSVYKSVKAMVADEDTVLDIVQDGFIKAFQSLEQLDAPEHFRAWLKRIATNKALDHLKKKKPLLFTDLENEEGELPDFADERVEASPEAVLDRKETARLLQEILATLSEEQRLVIGMFYYEEMSVRDIAQTLGCSENTVKSRLNYGRKKVEQKVRELEKKGIKLYSLAPLPFLLWLLRVDAEAAVVPSAAVLQAVTAQCATGAAVGTAVGSGISSLTVKVLIGAVAVAVAGGAAAVALSGGTTWQEASPTTQAVTQATEQTTQATALSYDALLADIQAALTIPTEVYDADPAHYDAEYAHLGEGTMYQLMHRKEEIYIKGIFSNLLDIDGDGQEELIVGRGVSPSRVTPIRIYKRDGTILSGAAVDAYADFIFAAFYDNVIWNYLGG